MYCVTISLFSADHQFKRLWLPPKRCPPRVCLLPPPLLSLHTVVAYNYSCTAPLARVVYWCKLSKWQILVAQTQSRHQSTAIEHNRHGLTSWLIALLITASRRVACVLWPSCVTTLHASSICVYYSLNFGGLHVTVNKQLNHISVSISLFLQVISLLCICALALYSYLDFVAQYVFV